MFKCDKCKRVTEPGEKLTKKAILKRDKVYQKCIKNKYSRKEEVKTTFGEETVKEINLCEKCASKG